MTTKEAFEELINQRAWYKDLGIPETTATNLKYNFGLGKVSIEKMEEILEKAGYKVVHEKVWSKGELSPIKRYLGFGFLKDSEDEDLKGMDAFIGDFSTVEEGFKALVPEYSYGYLFDTYTREQLIPEEYAQ